MVFEHEQDDSEMVLSGGNKEDDRLDEDDGLEELLLQELEDERDAKRAKVGAWLLVCWLVEPENQNRRQVERIYIMSLQRSIQILGSIPYQRSQYRRKDWKRQTRRKWQPPTALPIQGISAGFVYDAGLIKKKQSRIMKSKCLQSRHILREMLIKDENKTI